MNKGGMVRFEVRVLGRNIPIKISAGQEEETEKLVNEINEKIADFQLKFEKVDKIDSLIMVLLSYAFKQGASDDNRLKEQLLNKMKTLGNQLK